MDESSGCVYHSTRYRREGFEMTDALERLEEEKIPFLLCGYSSLDRYFRVHENGTLYLATDATTISSAVL